LEMWSTLTHCRGDEGKPGIGHPQRCDLPHFCWKNATKVDH
jgi:hypothetical protein